MTVREAFQKQLAATQPVTGEFFNPSEKPTRSKFKLVDENGNEKSLIPTDEEWEEHKRRLRTEGRSTTLGNKVQVGDIMLYALVVDGDPVGDTIFRHVSMFVNRELEEIERLYVVIPAKDKVMPLLCRKAEAKVVNVAPED